MKKLIVILAVIAMVGAFTATTMAAEWNLYGSARMATFFGSDDPGGSGSSSDELEWGLQGNSRIGANVKFNDQIGGRFEYGSGPNLRLLYGTYNFDGGQILLGQQYAPSTSFYSNSVYDGDGDLLGVGQFYIGRVPMVQLKMAGFKVALITPTSGASMGGVVTSERVYPSEFDSLWADPADIPYVDVAASTSPEYTWPKIEVSYQYKADQFFLDVFGGYQTYKELDTSIGSKDVDAYVLGFGGGFDFGAMYLKAGLHFSQNQGNYGAYNPAGMVDESVIANGKVIDNDGFGYLVVLGYKASDAVTLEAGYGSEENELDMAGAHKDQTVQYYANLSYTITPGFFIVPEIGFIDFKNSASGSDQGDFTYGGLKWQINF